MLNTPGEQESRGSDFQLVEGHGDAVFFAVRNNPGIDLLQCGRRISLLDDGEAPVLDRKG